MKGDRLGPYRVLGELGSGSTASVYLAEVVGEAPELDAGRRVALKLLHPQLEAAPRVVHRFLREVQVGNTLRHENVVRLLDAGEIRLDGCSRHYLAMEYVEGSTLRELITGEGAQPEALCRHVGCEVARGLAAIHACGAVHRDIKPENVVLTQDERVKIMDLGVARLRGASGRTSQSGDFIGSVLYAPPEQFLGPSDSVDGRADLYALGLTLYELATGGHPFQRETIEEVMRLQLTAVPRRPSALKPGLSPFLEYLLLRLLKKSPAQRFRSAELLCRTLKEGEESSWWRERSRLLRRVHRKSRAGPRIPRETRVFGREPVFARLGSLWEEVTQGQGRVLVITGEAGIGKSRVVDEFAARLDGTGQDFHVLYGAWSAVGPAATAGALCRAFRDHFDEDELAEGLAPFLTETPGLVPAFAALLRGEAPPVGAAALGREGLHTAFLNLTRALALEKPTLLVLDDLQDATPEAREVVGVLAQGIPGSRVLLILTERAGAAPPWHAQLPRATHVRRLDLGRLQEEDVCQLLTEALGSAHLAGRLAPRLTGMSDGNPLFLLEILQELRRSDILAAGERGAWILRGTLQDLRSPPRLRDLVHTRLAALGTEAREVLDAAATFGFEFDPALLADVLRRPRLGVLQELSRLERAHGLIRTRGRRCTFDHHALREILYADLPPPLRRAYHAAIGEALERGLDGPPPPSRAAAAETCHHFLRADRAAAALPWLDAALDHLAGGHLNAGAVELMDQVLAAPGLLDRSPRARLLLRKAERLCLMGRTVEEARALEEAARMASPKHDPLLASTASARLGDHLRRAGHPERALGFLSRAVVLAQRAGSQRAEVDATCYLGGALDDLGRHTEARDVVRRCLAYAHRTGDAPAEARARRQLARSRFRLGETDEALVELRASAALFETTGDCCEQGRAAAELGSLLVALGRYDEARPHIEHGLECAQTIGHRAGTAASLGDLGALCQSRGDLGEAEILFQQGLAILRECGGPAELGCLLTQIGALELLLGRTSRARTLLEEARTRLREIGHHAAEAWALLHLARVADQEEQEPSVAGALFHEALVLSERAGAVRDQTVIRITWALALFWRRDPAAAAEILDAGGAAWRATDSRDALLLGRALELALGRPGDEVAARRLLGTPTTPTARYEARALLYLARREPGDLEVAWREVMELRERAPVASWSGFIRGMRVRRRIREAWEAAHASNPRAQTE